MYRLETSRPPVRSPNGGIRTSLTSEFTTEVNAAPTTMPTARSTTFPRAMKLRNSAHIHASSGDRGEQHAQRHAHGAAAREWIRTSGPLDCRGPSGRHGQQVLQELHRCG